MPTPRQTLDTVTGTITASGQSVAADVSRASNISVHIIGTFAGLNVTFEGSLDGTNWFGVQAVRTNAATIETTSGVVANTLAYAWELSVNAFGNFRVRATAWTSGTATVVIVPGIGATEPAPTVPTHAVTISGTPATTTTMTSTTIAAPAATIAGSSIAKIVSAASTNATNAKSSAGRLLGWELFNSSASAKYVKIFNLAVAPTVGSSTPVFTIGLPAGGHAVLNGLNPITFATGIAYAITGAYADLDTTAVAAGDVVGALFYV